MQSKHHQHTYHKMLKKCLAFATCCLPDSLPKHTDILELQKCIYQCCCTAKFIFNTSGVFEIFELTS